jgi:hypothetical protein
MTSQKFAIKDAKGLHVFPPRKNGPGRAGPGRAAILTLNDIDMMDKFIKFIIAHLKNRHSTQQYRDY